MPHFFSESAPMPQNRFISWDKAVFCCQARNLRISREAAASFAFSVPYTSSRCVMYSHFSLSQPSMARTSSTFLDVALLAM